MTVRISTYAAASQAIGAAAGEATPGEATPGVENEDAVAVAPDGSAAVLVDGAGLPRELRAGCIHSVPWYAQTLAAAMLARLSARTGEVTTALAQAIGDVRAAHGPDCAPELGSPSSTLAAWRIAEGPTGSIVEYLVLCDSSLFIRHADGTVVEVVDEAVDLLTGARRAAVAADLVAGGMAPRAAAIEAFRVTTEPLRNVEGGFWCAHLDPGAAAHALTGSVPLDDVDALVLASDGATRLVHPYGELAAEDFVSAALTGSHDELVTRLRSAEEAHAAEAARIAVKVHDDATIVAAPIGGVRPLPGAAGAAGFGVRRARAGDLRQIVALMFADQLGGRREAEADDPVYAAAFARIDADPGELLAVVVDAGRHDRRLLPALAATGVGAARDVTLPDRGGPDRGGASRPRGRCGRDALGDRLGCRARMLAGAVDQRQVPHRRPPVPCSAAPR